MKKRFLENKDRHREWIPVKMNKKNEQKKSKEMCAEQIPCLGEEKCVNDTSGRNYFNSIENGSQHIIVCLCLVWYILSQFIGHLPQIIFSRCTALFLGFFSIIF